MGAIANLNPKKSIKLFSKNVFQATTKQNSLVGNSQKRHQKLQLESGKLTSFHVGLIEL